MEKNLHYFQNSLNFGLLPADIELVIMELNVNARLDGIEQLKQLKLCSRDVSMTALSLPDYLRRFTHVENEIKSLL